MYTGHVVDTLLMSRLQSPHRQTPKGYKGRGPHSVEAWGVRFGSLKIEHEDWTQYSEDMLERCKQDVEIQQKIYYALRKEGEGKNLGAAHKLNVKLFHYLQLQEEYGWTFDREHVKKNLATLDRWMKKIEKVLAPHLPMLVIPLETKTKEGYAYVKKPFKKNGEYSKYACEYLGEYIRDCCGPFSRFTIRPISLDSTVEVKQFLLDQGWKPAKWNEKDGKRTSANLSKDDPFDGVQSALGKLVAKRIQCRQRRSVLEGWQKNCREDGKLSPRVGGIATTGRLRHAGIVNVPSPHSGAFFAVPMRQCFTARKGWKMVGVDSKGNQMRQLAARMGDEEFTHAVLFGTQEDKTDLHSLNQRRSGAATRSLAKNFFYGSILFGAGDAKTAKLLDTTKEKARKLKEDYLNGMPKLKAVIEGLKKEWHITAKRMYNPRFNRVEYFGGYIRGIDGRGILVPFEKDLLCYALQSDEAIQMGAAYVILHKRAEKKGWKLNEDWQMLIWMHDEFQMESRPEIVEELGQLGCKAIKWAGEFFNINCPHDGEYLIGDNWNETH